MTTELIHADYQNPQHAKDILFLLNAYAQDPMGGGESISEYVKDNLISGLSKLDYAHSVLAYVDSKPAGLINFFEAFSTFKAKPLINIHDIVVMKEFRGSGVSQAMLKKVETFAKEKGCCKLTLEVLQGNDVAKSAYEKYGFSDYELDPKMGCALFWQKEI